MLYRFIGTNVDVDFGVHTFDVDRGVEPAVIHLQDSRDRLNGWSGPAGVAEHRLRRVDFQLPHVVTKNLLDRRNLGEITQWRRCRVGTEIIDLVRLNATILQQSTHGPRLAVS